MARENFDVEVPDGTHLGFSKDSDGAYRGHLFSDDTNKLVGHAELIKPARNDAFATGPTPVFVYVQDDRADAAAAERQAQQREETLEAVLKLVAIGVQVSPYVKTWWVNSAAPAAREAKDKFGQRHRDRKAARAALNAAAEETIASGDAVADTRANSGAATEAGGPVMSSNEAWNRFNAAIRARQFSDEQLAMLREAHIEDGSDLLNLTFGAAADTRRIEPRAVPIIEAGPAPLDESTLAQVRTLLEADHFDEAHLPVRDR